MGLCQQELKQITTKNEKLRLQEEELTQHKAMTNRVSVGQPSITSIVSTLDTIPMVYNDIFS